MPGAAAQCVHVLRARNQAIHENELFDMLRAKAGQHEGCFPAHILADDMVQTQTIVACGAPLGRTVR